MRLPEEFLTKMTKLLNPGEYEEFLKAFDLPRYYGLRVNTLKVSVDNFLKLSPFKLEPVPWSKDGFYYEAGESPGKHPYYHAGLYYIQEPSAMLPAEVLGAKPGDRVLDLCAAPGGKTVRIAAGMKGKGLLVANDINPDRVKALVKNIELCGVRNAVVTTAEPRALAQRFISFFDKILIDAPCSGEGMFRKDEDAVKSWGKYKCETCSSIQHEIIEHASVMLKEGGTLVYSTCTFSPEEDEGLIASFLERHPEFAIEKIEKCCGMENGRPEWAGDIKALEYTARLWPHRIKGEGHFVARLVKTAAAAGETAFNDSLIKAEAAPAALVDFSKEYLNYRFSGNILRVGDNIYQLPDETPQLSGIKVSKFGWYLGELKNGRFEPSHSMVMAIDSTDVTKVLDFPSDSSDLYKYLKGETLMLDGEKGYYAICVDGFTVGWAKQSGGILKNLYPKGWRKLS